MDIRLTRNQWLVDFFVAEILNRTSLLEHQEW